MSTVDEDEQPRTYPGSSQVRRALTGPPPDPWDEIPYMVLTVKGVDRKFYTVGVLAEALGRQSQTIRKWERQGYIPPSGFRTPGLDRHGQKRIYSRAQIEGLVELAAEFGLMENTVPNIPRTGFPARAKKLFADLKKASK